MPLGVQPCLVHFHGLVLRISRQTERRWPHTYMHSDNLPCLSDPVRVVCLVQVQHCERETQIQNDGVNQCFHLRKSKLQACFDPVDRRLTKANMYRGFLSGKLNEGRKTAEKGSRQSTSGNTPFENERGVNIRSPKQVEKQTNTRTHAKIKNTGVDVGSPMRCSSLGEHGKTPSQRGG